MTGRGSRQLPREADDAQLLKDMNADFERLNNDRIMRRYDAELHDWDATLLAGLEHEETSDG